MANMTEMHMLGVFQRVLERNKTLTLQLKTEDGQKDIHGGRIGMFPRLVITTMNEDVLEVLCYNRPEHITIACDRWIHDVATSSSPSRVPFYEFRFERKKYPKLRKQALILSKKIQFMHIHEVMNS